MPVKRNILDIVDDLRKVFYSSGLTQEKFADKIGISQPRLSRLLSQHANEKPKVATDKIMQICKKLNIKQYMEEEDFDPIKDQSFVDSIRKAVRSDRSRAKKIQELLKAAEGF